MNSAQANKSSAYATPGGSTVTDWESDELNISDSDSDFSVTSSEGLQLTPARQKADMIPLHASPAMAEPASSPPPPLPPFRFPGEERGITLKWSGCPASTDTRVPLRPRTWATGPPRQRHPSIGKGHLPIQDEDALFMTTKQNDSKEGIKQSCGEFIRLKPGPTRKPTARDLETIAKYNALGEVKQPAEKELIQWLDTRKADLTSHLDNLRNADVYRKSSNLQRVKSEVDVRARLANVDRDRRVKFLESQKDPSAHGSKSSITNSEPLDSRKGQDDFFAGMRVLKEATDPNTVESKADHHSHLPELEGSGPVDIKLATSADTGKSKTATVHFMPEPAMCKVGSVDSQVASPPDATGLLGVDQNQPIASNPDASLASIPSIALGEPTTGLLDSNKPLSAKSVDEKPAKNTPGTVPTLDRGSGLPSAFNGYDKPLDHHRFLRDLANYRKLLVSLVLAPAPSRNFDVMLQSIKLNGVRILSNAIQTLDSNIVTLLDHLVEDSARVGDDMGKIGLIKGLARDLAVEIGKLDIPKQTGIEQLQSHNGYAAPGKPDEANPTASSKDLSLLHCSLLQAEKEVDAFSALHSKTQSTLHYFLRAVKGIDQDGGSSRVPPGVFSATIKILQGIDKDLRSSSKGFDDAMAKLRNALPEHASGRHELAAATLDLAETKIALANTKKQLADKEELLMESQQQLAQKQDQLHDFNEIHKCTRKQLSDVEQQLSDTEKQFIEVGEQLIDAQKQLADKHKQLCETEKLLHATRPQVTLTRGSGSLRPVKEDATMPSVGVSGSNAPKAMGLSAATQGWLGPGDVDIPPHLRALQTRIQKSRDDIDRAIGSFNWRVVFASKLGKLDAQNVPGLAKYGLPPAGSEKEDSIDHFRTIAANIYSAVDVVDTEYKELAHVLDDPSVGFHGKGVLKGKVSTLKEKQPELHHAKDGADLIDMQVVGSCDQVEPKLTNEAVILEANLKCAEAAPEENKSELQAVKDQLRASEDQAKEIALKLKEAQTAREDSQKEYQEVKEQLETSEDAVDGLSSHVLSELYSLQHQVDLLKTGTHKAHHLVAKKVQNGISRLIEVVSEIETRHEPQESDDDSCSSSEDAKSENTTDADNKTADNDLPLGSDEPKLRVFPGLSDLKDLGMDLAKMGWKPPYRGRAGSFHRAKPSFSSTVLLVEEWEAEAEKLYFRGTGCRYNRATADRDQKNLMLTYMMNSLIHDKDINPDGMNKLLSDYSVCRLGFKAFYVARESADT